MVNSLAKRLTYRIMAVVLVMMAVITGIVYFSVRQYMSDEAQERYEGISLRDQEELRRRLDVVRVATENYVSDVELDLNAPDKIEAHLERFLRINPTIVRCGLLYEPGYFPDKGRCFGPFATRDSDNVVRAGRIDSDYNTYMDKEWYKKGLSTDSADWSEVFYEENVLPYTSTRRQLITFYAPVHDEQGRPVAMLCSDLSLEFLRDKLMDDLLKMREKFEKGSTHHSYSFVIDHEGTYIVHPDENRMLNANFFHESRRTANTIDDHIVTSMTKGEKGSAMVDIDGIPSWIYYRNVKYMKWVIAIVVPKEVIFRNGHTLNTIILLMMLVGMIAIYLICRHMIRQTTRPLTKFALSADEVALGNFSSPLPEIKGNDEVRLLHDAFLNMQESLKVYFDQLQETTTSKASLERELSIAHNIQMAMLPKTFPPYPERNDIDIYASETPAREVGGDLYDFFLVRGHEGISDRLYFCIGDVSGKGMPAALFMAVMRAMFRSEARRSERAADIVDNMNRNLSEEYTAGYFVTMFVGILDLATGHLDYCNAGHEAPLVSGKPLPIKPNLPVGALADWNYEGQEARLKSGDMLFLYTDGLSEANDPDKRKFGRLPVRQLASRHSDCTAQQLVQVMTDEVHRHANGAEQNDDITLMAIRWNEECGKRREELTMQASMDDIGRLRPYIEDVTRQAGIIGKESKRLRLAVEEAVANVINYGEATTVTLSAAVRDRRLVLTITDDGRPFDPTDDSPTDLSVPADQRPPGGMGIVLLHQMTDGLSYKRSDGRNILTILKNI